MTEKIATPRGMMHIEVNRTSANVKGEVACICPICTPGREPQHQKEKKLSVNIFSNAWRCNHCGAAGYILKDVPDRSNGEKIAYLRRALPMEEKDHNAENLWTWYERTRGIPRSVAIWLGSYVTIKELTLKHAPEGYESLVGQKVKQHVLAFPFLNDGAVVDCQYRDWLKNFTMEYGTDKIFYNLDSVKGKTKVLITEGMIDVASIYTAIGMDTDWAVVSVPNGATISPAEEEIFKQTGNVEVINEVNLSYYLVCQPKFEKIVEYCFAGDADAAGIKLRKSFFRILSADTTKTLSWVDWAQVKRADGSNCKDANDVLLVDPTKIIYCINTRKFTGSTSVRTAIDCKPEIISHYFNGLTMALKSGYPKFDYHFGIKAGDLVIGTGWQGAGKTSFTLNLMLCYAWHYNWKWAIWSPENYPESLIYEQISEILMNKSMDRKSDVKFTVAQIERALVWIHDHFYCIEMKKDITYTPADIRVIATKMVQMYGINGILIDPWNSLLEDDTYYKLGGHKWLENQLTLQNAFSKQYSVTSIILAHPITLDSKDRKGNDDGSFRHPTIYQIDGGKIWSAKADVYFTVHRPNSSNKTDVVTEVYVQKLKVWKLYGIPTGEINPVVFTMDPTTGRFKIGDQFPIDSSTMLNDDKQTEINF
jgi:twinkle protein